MTEELLDGGRNTMREKKDISEGRMDRGEEDGGEYIILNHSEEEDEKQDEKPSVFVGSEYQYFDFDAVRKHMRLTSAMKNRGYSLCQEQKICLEDVESGYGEETNKVMGYVSGEGRDGKKIFPVRIVFSRDEIIYGECNCTECQRHYYFRYYRREYCAYLSALLDLAEKAFTENHMGDATDKRAMLLMRAFAQRHADNLVAGALGSAKSLKLLPRIIRKEEGLAVSFKVGAEKLFVVKNLAEFYDNVRNSKIATYGNKTDISHHINNFTESGKRWIEYIGRIVTEEQSFQRRVIAAYGYAGRNVFKAGEAALSGWRLDEFYELMGQEGVEYEEKIGDKKRKDLLRAGEGNPKITLHIRKNDISDRRTFHGIRVDCRMPQIYQGVRAAYYIRENGFCRIQEEFMRKIRTLAEFGTNGSLSFEVGRNNLTQFYYTVLPQLEGAVDITEENPREIASYLPPKVKFVFYLDAENHNMRCRVRARYGASEFSVLDLLDEQRPWETFRDEAGESEILFLIKQWFPYYDPEREELHCGEDDELMYGVLDKGVEALLELGEVQCTRRFTNINAGRRVRLSVGVSVSGDLLNLEISTQDVPPEELLDILRSYRQKKKYYRLKNGDFLSLEDESIKTVDELMTSLRMSPRELMKGNVKLPLYRALYLDSLLEKNEEIYSNRDSHFRRLVKSFKTVKDADFEIPVSLKGLMRGYQETGYRWLRMLETYRLGGILADDMGLGKTLQVLAVLLSAKQEGKLGTSLVVSPASLIYNWGEEIRRFTPELTFEVISGNQEERIKKLEQSGDVDVIVTSYDLLKRDVAYYEDREFDYQIIDEAQYIKNQNTAAAKAVKVIKSGTRFALTGTPIENRLSELWSIFDYLIPGYLYGYEDFKNSFEAPIVKENDGEALERLQRMTAPFILRRMKENVLKDLPEKLEESRYVRLESDQQKLYDAQLLYMKQKLASQDTQEFQKNKMQILAELMKLRQICCDPSLCFENYKGESAKLEACVELIKSAVEGNHKILLFSQFTSMLELIAGRLEQEKLSFFTITGSTPKEKRLELVRIFNGDDTKVFLISLRAGGVGLNLIGADVVIHYDPWWNFAVQNQATDRAHRIGQTRKVVVYRLIAKGTIEERIEELQESKRALSEQIVRGDTGQLGAMTKEDFISLLS